ncbi:MAG: 3-phosphoshikimate 1-carboxyvinyltransferase [Bacteroidetes bacterium]|nr:3-phosphoshikimate 1-carboxyvinyltransferase [Bacteroidota bacterium]MCB0708084.1 3-phosphoshikimate 1-carboxyvinyltransferase [Chitinophagaceae bacterium]
MIVKINPSAITGTIKAPASKSSMQRACALALLANGQTTIYNAGHSNDDLAALEIIKKLGATIELKEEELIITGGTLKDITTEINCGESGLGIRMFAPITALSTGQISINGTGSLLKRPMHFFDEIFPQLGVSVQSDNGYLPITIKGPLKPANIIIDGSLSSQFLTGLLIAFANATTKPVTITVTNLLSKPYIDLTLQMIKKFGYNVENDNYKKFLIEPSAQKQIHHAYTVEGDWSGAAFLLVAAAIAGDIKVTGLDVFSTQADKAILSALMDCGVNISIKEKQITINTALSKNGKPFQFDATNCPDLFPPLVALAAYCNGTTVIKGANRLQHKESNRALTLQQEFAKMGVEITIKDDLMLIDGGGEIKAAVLQSHHDHRIAMACAVAALKANGPSVIEDAESINKSYPVFFDDLKLLHASVSLI